MVTIDLNCDLGESFGAYTIGNDEAILPYVTSANIACGFHAGDPSVMQRTVELALRENVAIGAHPGLPDLSGFGRRNMAISAREAFDITLYQIGALSAFCQALGAPLHHVKPHGALYNMAAVNTELAEGIAEAIYTIGEEVILYGLAGSALVTAGKRIGLSTANEVFADRTYEKDGTLTPRTIKGSVIHDTQQAINQVITMIKEGKVHTRQGEQIKIEADTVCIHGDGPNAIVFAKSIHHQLKEERIIIQTR
ncbi:lactam utilization protein LamB [Priestia aryabhattai]|uniref:LamB/YcsF family protein n=1 Tax=Priestia flexa TaxID=86664 RepID=UPI000BA044FC|nr:lactam utilization protein LamB [Priestia aryabhattai]USY56003.1 LamB/YcsF family protein [Bacillus sp. 1780r2a1]